ncbi:MAG: carbohydrate binding domain-containing protein [Planctomycetaceae bacterium]|jgi:hypothetical protein|nr:carbohydrate binding domain-containing protein [Planctomycetaceae bacterium]
MKHFLLTLFVFVYSPLFSFAADEFKLWVYLPANLLVDANVENSIKLIHRASQAGYNGVLLTDSKFCRWDKLPERYAENVKRFRNECRKLNLELFAAVCPVGYSNDMLSRNPNLAEGLPVVNAPFFVQNGKLVPEPVDVLKNGSFEEHRGNSPTGWGFIDEPGKISFIDGEVKSNGRVSLRMQDIGLDEPRNGRAMQKLTVEPFHYYHVSVQIKTESFDSTAAMNIAVLGEDGMSLNWHFPKVEPTQDWKQIDITFNSLENSSVNIYFGTWGGRKGKVWWDDVRIEQGGFVNVLRRDGTPLKMTSGDGKTEYAEGIDVEPLVDKLTGNDPYEGCFTAWHKPPEIAVPKTSRLKEGQRVLISYYHTAVIYGEQVGMCMAEPETREMLRWQIEQVKKNLDPDGYFMSYDEMRQAGWDKSCLDTGKRPAEVLADNVEFCVKTIKEIAPGKEIAVWSDMFDPLHNASKDGYYYLVKGKAPWFGSWEKLPKDVIVGNWNSDPKIRKESYRHFAQRGHQQMLAGYYDAEPVKERIRQWMQDVSPDEKLRGVIYTTWTNNYGPLERFAEAVKKEFYRQR